MKIGRQPPPPPGNAALRTVTRDTKWGLVVQKAPRKRGKATQGYDFYRQREFGNVVRMLKYADPLAYQTAVEWAKNTDQIPRDVLMMAAMGTLFEIVFEDGTTMESARLSNPNAQYILDGVTDVVGSILYRAPIGWVGLAPGNAGQFLTMDGNATPYWGGSESQIPAPWKILNKSYYPVDGNAGLIQSTDLQGCDDILIVANGVASSAGNRAYVSVTVDGGTSWSAGSDFRLCAANGILTTPSLWDLWSAGSTGARSGMAIIHNVRGTGYPKFITCPNQNRWGYYQANWNPVNGVRVQLTGSDTKTAGGFWILGR